MHTHTHAHTRTHTKFAVHHCSELCFALFGTLCKINVVIFSKVVCVFVTLVLHEVSLY